jgi:plastocyanin/mono/diheme cytochrome c family protein
MNTRKQVMIMSALLLMMLIIVAGYAAWYPSRATDAEEEFDTATAERASLIFARNCRLCHGDVGQGGALGGRLAAAPALARPDLQGFADSGAVLTEEVNPTTTTLKVDNVTKLKGGQVILLDEERMKITAIDGTTLTVQRAQEHTKAAGHFPDTVVWAFDSAELSTDQDLITNTISCGRVGTAMPVWSQEHGGPLSDEQIRQLMTLITQARWDLVQAEVNKEDLLATRLLDPLTADSITMHVSDVTRLNDEDAIRLGDERLRVKELPTIDPNAKDKSGLVQVERGILDTVATDHDISTPIYHFPDAPNEPTIVQSSCGQTAKAPVPQGTPGLIEPFSGQTVEIAAQNVSYDKKELTVNSGGQVRIRFTNNDEGVPHNIAVYKSATDPTPVSDGSVGVEFPGVNTDDTVFTAPPAGKYFFRCDVHPTLMTGTFTVN